MESLLFENSKHKKDILFIFTDCYLLNDNVHRNTTTIVNNKYSIYNYSNYHSRIFLSAYIKSKAYGIRFTYYNRDKSRFNSMKYIQK